MTLLLLFVEGTNSITRFGKYHSYMHDHCDIIYSGSQPLPLSNEGWVLVDSIIINYVCDQCVCGAHIV